MTWQSYAFFLVAGCAVGFAGYRFSILYRMAKAHKGGTRIFSEFPSRTISILTHVLGQKAVLERRVAGIIHATVFWGFLIISIGTLEQFATTIYSGADFQFLGNEVYQGLVFVMDLFTLLVLVAVAGAFYRRLIIRPEGLGKSKDAVLILLFTGSLMVSIFLMNGFHFLGEEVWFESSMPFSSTVSSVLSQLRFSDSVNAHLGTAFKWVHMLIVLGFLMYIPGSKHLHVAAAGPNTFLRPLKIESPMVPINFEDESIEQYGAAKTTDLSWKDTLDYYSCTECGRCQDICPAWNTQKPLSPKLLIIGLRNGMFNQEKTLLSGGEIVPIIDENVTEDVIWSCTTCRACESACPVFIGHTDKIYDIRRNLVMMESKFPTEVQTVFKNLETNGTPWAFSAEDRTKWAEGLNVQTIEENPNAEVLFWVGCAGAFDERNKKVVQAFARIMKKAQIQFAILGTKEKCTGDSARRIGNEYLFQTLAKENIENLNKYKVKKIVTTCPHCMNTLKNEYPDFGGHYEVTHHSQFISDLIKEGKLKPSKGQDSKIVYHDSCYMGRWNNVYDEPRDIVKSLPAANLVEMKNNKKESMCCGAGGGRMWMEETLGKRINVTRTEQAIDTKADTIALNCPFCMTMLTDGVKERALQDKIQVKDIAELVDQST